MNRFSRHRPPIFTACPNAVSLLSLGYKPPLFWNLNERIYDQFIHSHVTNWPPEHHPKPLSSHNASETYSYHSSIYLPRQHLDNIFLIHMPISRLRRGRCRTILAAMLQPFRIRRTVVAASEFGKGTVGVDVGNWSPKEVRAGLSQWKLSTVECDVQELILGNGLENTSRDGKRPLLNTTVLCRASWILLRWGL
jgi:hypothetical protein